MQFRSRCGLWRPLDVVGHAFLRLAAKLPERAAGTDSESGGGERRGGADAVGSWADGVGAGADGVRGWVGVAEWRIDGGGVLAGDQRAWGAIAAGARVPHGDGVAGWEGVRVWGRDGGNGW